MFNLFKKKNEETPPDVGKEASEAVTEVTPDDIPVDDSRIDDEKPKNISQGSAADATLNGELKFEIEKIHARLEAANEFMKGFNERFSIMNQQIGEVRAMALSNEKEISKSTMESQKAVDIVREVKPEELRVDYQKMDLKSNSLLEKIESNKQYMESMMEELKELKRKAGLFEGTDALIKLQEDVKKDLIELQKMSSRVRMNADKSEQIFIELRKGFNENEKTNQSLVDLQNSYTQVKKDLDKLKIDHSQVIQDRDFFAFRRNTERKLAFFESAFSQIEQVKDNHENLRRLIEEILALEKRNEEDIGDIGITLGKDNVRRVSDFDERLLAVLTIIDKIATDMNNIKIRLGMKKPKTQDIYIVPQTPVKRISDNVKEALNKEQKDNEFLKDIPEKRVENIPKQPKILAPEILPNENISNKPDIESIEETENKNDIKKDTQTEVQNMPVPEKIRVRDINEISSNNGKVNNLKREIPNINDFRRNKLIHERKINDLLFEGGYCLVNGDFSNALNKYKEVSDAYNPAYDRNKALYNKIAKYYENILRLSNRQAEMHKADDREDMPYASRIIKNRENY